MIEKRRFKLHPVNIILAIVAVGFGITRPFLLGSEGAEASAYELGRSFGFGFGLILVSSVGAMFVWFVSRKNLTAANVVFGGLMCFGALGQVAQTLQDVNQNQDWAEFRETMQEEPDADVERTRDVTNSFLEDMIENSSGDERKSFEATKVFMSKLLDARERWEAAELAFVDDRILDIARLNSAEEYAFQKTVIKEYADASSHIAITYETSFEIMQTALTDTGISEKYAVEFMEGFRPPAEKTNAAAARLFSAHESYATACIRLVEILESNEWTFDEDTEELVFDSEKADEEYWQTVDTVLELETKIDELAEELDRIEQAKAAAQQQ